MRPDGTRRYRKTLSHGLFLVPPQTKAGALEAKHGMRIAAPPSSPEDSIRFSEAGRVEGHYFRQDLYVAQRIFDLKPSRHMDAGSRIDGFVAHVASFRPLEVFDIRPLHSPPRNVTFRQVDLMDHATLPAGYCDSLSCLHVIEHLGLARYGDRMDSNGWVKGLAGLKKILAEGGRLYLSTSIGRQRNLSS